MDKPIVVLALAAIALAGAGAYLLERIDSERAPLPASPAGPASIAGSGPGDAPESPARVPGLSAAPAAPATPASPTDSSRVDTRAPGAAPAEDPRARQRRQAAEYLAQYDDPDRRVALREGELAGVRRSTAGAAERFKLTPAQYETLVQLITEQTMERRVATARCVADPLCLKPPSNSDAHQALDRQIRDLIGDGGLRELSNFSRAERERRAVDSLRSRLSGGNALSQAQADELTAALFDESRQQDRAMRDQHRMGFSTGEGLSLLYTDRATSMELMLQSGEAYVQAMRDRAATQLSGEQLAMLNEMYDDLLIEFRRHLRRKAARP
jgi:hypothetical protein